MKKFNLLNAVMYTARIWALLIAVALIFTMLSNQFGFGNAEASSFLEIFTFLFVPVLLCIGLMWAYKDEWKGGLLSLGSLIGFYALNPHMLESYGITSFLLTPTLLFIWIGWVKRSRQRD